MSDSANPGIISPDSRLDSLDTQSAVVQAPRSTTLDNGVLLPWKDKQANHDFIQGRLPVWYTQASAELRAALRKSQLFGLFSQREMAPICKKLKTVQAFAAPLLEHALIQAFNLRLDLHKNNLVTVHSQTILGMDRRRPFEQSLLQAALQNFEAFEAEEDGFERGAALLPADGLQLQLVEGTGVNGRYPRFRYRYYGIIDIKPQRFAALCRTLDLGRRYQEHLDSVFKPASATGRAVDGAQLVAATFMRSEQDAVQVLAHIALMKKHIGTSAYQMLMELTTPEGQPTWDGLPVRHGWMKMLSSLGVPGNTLYGALLIEPDKAGDEDSPCVVYMPGEPEHPLKEYPSFKAFTNALRRKLSGIAYQRYFRRFISLRTSQRFFQRLNERLMPLRPLDSNPLSAGLRRRTFDAQADLSLEKVGYASPPFKMLHEHLLIKTYEDSRVLAVPTGDEDQKTRMARLHAHESLGLDLLNVAAFFVPVVGVGMAVYAVEQVLSDIFIGIDEWRHGEVDEALTHLFDAAENIALAAVTGVAGSAKVPASPVAVPSVFIENMIPVKLGNGQTRLWKPDLVPFQQEMVLPNWVVATAEGRVEVEGKTWLPLAGKLYQVELDPALKKWRIKHPTDAAKYSPILEHNGAGAWRHEGENSMGWDLHTSFKRLHASLEAFPEETIERIMAVTQADEALLRQVHVEKLAPPALLRDSIHRFRIEQQLDGFIDAMSSDHLHKINVPRIDPYLELLTLLPGWPPERALRLLDQQGAVLKSYNVKSDSTLPGIDLRYEPGRMDEVLASVLGTLQQGEIDTLLGEYNTRNESRSARLAANLADVAKARRQALRNAIYQLEDRSDEQAVRLIQRDFPTTPVVVANEMIESASTLEKTQMSVSDRLPLRIAEQAREYQQQLRLNRANEGFYFKDADNPDTATAGFRLLQRLPGWPKDLALDIRESSFSGALLDSLGDRQTTTQRWVLVKSGNRYQTFDSVGNMIDTGGHPFFSSLLQALPPDTRTAIGLSTTAREHDLREALGAIAVGQREVVAQALQMQKIKPGFKWPRRLADGRVGYPLSGRMRGLFARLGHGASRYAAEPAIKNLFPGFSDSEVRSFIDELSAEHTGPANTLAAYVQGRIQTLETQYEQLEITLDRWVASGSEVRMREGGVQFVMQVDKGVAAARIKRCWKRLSEKRYAEDGQFIGYELDLSQLAIGEVPALSARFDHVGSLLANDVGLTTEGAEVLLRQCSNLRLVYLRGNELTSIPEALTAQTGLIQLSLRGNPLVLDQASVNRLQGLRRLVTLNLNHCPIGPLLNVSPLRHLVRLSLRATDISALPAGLSDCVNLLILDLRNNHIVDIPETTFDDARIIYRRIQLHDNPLNEQTLERARRLLSDDARRLMGIEGVRRHAQSDLPASSFWLEGVPTEERPARLSTWSDLQAEPEAADFFRVLLDLTESADFRDSRQALTRRVWTVVEAATQHGALRDELFTLAAHPETCGDGVTIVFNNLEIRVLIFKVMGSTGEAAQEIELFKLARGLDRLDEVEKIALSDIAIRSISDPYLDQAEVRLAYRIGLAERLELPLQPRSMLFSSLGGVTDQALDAAEQRVLQREKTLGFLEALVARDFWLAFLEQHHKASFEPVKTPFHERLSDLDDRASATLRTDQYLEQVALIQEEREAAVKALALQLTQATMTNERGGVKSTAI